MPTQVGSLSLLREDLAQNQHLGGGWPEPDDDPISQCNGKWGWRLKYPNLC